MKRKSIIFTNKELDIMEKRRNEVKGIRSDPHGTFASRIKPKIIEILSWFSKRKLLRKLIKTKSHAGLKTVEKIKNGKSK